MRSTSNLLRIVVLGYIVRGPIGGMAWHHLQYVLGLMSLGHDVLFLEDSDEYPSCYDPTRHVVDVDPRYGLKFATESFHRLGISDRWAYFDWHRNAWWGAAGERAVSFCRDADLVLNVSGVNPLRDWTALVNRRALIDTDPVFTQLDHLKNEAKRQRAAAHNSFFSFGECLMSNHSTAPQDGFAWRPTRQPVTLTQWPEAAPKPSARFTTVMQWDSYPTVEYEGKVYGMKSTSFQDYFDLPRQANESFELALGGVSAPRQELQTRGWRIVDPLEVTRDPWSYQRYIHQSKAEFSVAKHGYVVSRSGWFSERSSCYLASGRPVVIQNTGFSAYLPTGLGILAFTDAESARTAVADVSARYDAHCKAAREIAAAYFDAERVLQSLVERAMN